MPRPLKVEEALESDVRQRIFDLIRDSPGIHTTALARAAGRSVTATLWHVQMLVRAGVVATERDGRFLRHYLTQQGRSRDGVVNRPLRA